MALPSIPCLARGGLLEAAQNSCRFCKVFLAIWHEHPDNAVFWAVNNIEDCFVCLRGFPNCPSIVEFEVYDPEHGKLEDHEEDSMIFSLSNPSTTHRFGLRNRICTDFTR
jgi:hypothetical protein